MTELTYPSILRRYLSSVLDGMFIAVMFIGAGYMLPNNSELLTNIRIILLVILLLIYEPLCTSKLCTLGQKITGIRIRDHKNRENIPLLRAYMRVIAKVFLGFISLLSIMFSEDRRAIHDYIAGSIVLEDKADSHQFATKCEDDSVVG